MRSRLTKLPRLPDFRTIGHDEKVNVLRSLNQPLSGYLGGIERSSGLFVNRLEREWADTFGVKNAIACNSATSGLFAACMAAGIRNGDRVWTTPYTMSATAACAVMLGAKVDFIDIEPTRYSIDMEKFPTGGSKPKAIIVTNIFGHPAYLRKMRTWCDQNNVILIEDNAQSPFAMEDGQYAGTIGHIGVFSLNVHKHIQAGEGGVVTTNSEGLALSVRETINHGELGGGHVGLNLRMTEPVAAIACAQLRKAPKIIEGRRKLAGYLSDIFSLIPWIEPSREDKGCRHVYYLWTARVPPPYVGTLVQFMENRGVPLRAGYSVNLCDIFDPSQGTPVAREVDKSLISFEACAYDPRISHLQTLRKIVKQAKDAF